MIKLVIKFILLLTLGLFITSCGPGQLFGPTITPTSTSTPTATPTPTPIPLSGINLEPILIQSGDLPAGYSGAQIGDPIYDWMDNITGYENRIYQEFENNGKASGGITVFLFEEESERNAAYNYLASTFPGATKTSSMGALSEVGEYGMYSIVVGKLGYIILNIKDEIFVRCHALVFIRMLNVFSIDSVTAYAKRLDKRLSELVCP